MKIRETERRVRAGLFAAFVAAAMLAGAPAVAQDVCGCADSTESLGAFDSGANALLGGTWDAGSSTITIPMPADGVLIYDSFDLVGNPDDPGGAATLKFATNAANTPVTILVKGDFEIGTGMTLSVEGLVGGDGTDDVGGQGGLGGPGGFPGGDGAYLLVNGAAEGGAGVGPGGGLPLGTGGGGGGEFRGSSNLQPLLGGSGAAGGFSENNSISASGAGGGGGGGAILVAANGTIAVDGLLTANGGDGGVKITGASIGGSGGGGGGGAVRLLAPSISGAGTITATGGIQGPDSWHPGTDGTDGRVRLESPSITLGLSATDPIAQREAAIGPVVSPFAQTVTVLSVGGVAVTPPPSGSLDGIDVTVAAPGPVPVVVESANVPAGTLIDVTFKGKLDAVVVTESGLIEVGNCDGAGVCTTTISPVLQAADYTLEALATFQTP